MPIKLIALLKAAPGIRRDMLMSYYETHHVPLILELMPGIIDYRRNYLTETSFGAFVITELTFAHQGALDNALATVSVPEIAERIARDEDNFLDRSATQLAVAEECGGLVDHN